MTRKSAAARRDELVHLAEHRALYEALWDRTTAEDLRARIPADAFAGRAALVWDLVSMHDAVSDPWPGAAPDTHSWSGPGRIQSVLALADRIRAEPPETVAADAATLSRLWAVAVREHELMLHATAPASPWRIDIDTAVQVLCLAPTYRRAAFTLTQLDALTAQHPAPLAPAASHHDEPPAA